MLCLATLQTQAETFTLTPKEKACSQALNACDDAIKKADSLIDAKNKVIDAQKKEADLLSKALVKAQDQRDSIFRNPFLWLFIGAVIGGVGAGIAVHK